MKFSAIVEQASELLRHKGRLTYRALKREFDLDDEALADLTAELTDGQRVAVDEDGKVLVWVGEGGKGETARPKLSVLSPQPLVPSTQPLTEERRQLTVMFCDLVGSTALSEQLDPEELREVVRAYQESCTEVIRQYDGYIAQHLGDGLLVYFGYPVAHEDDAARAVRAGLEVVEKIHTLRVPSPVSTGEGRGEGRLQVRIGIHTGLVVIGEIGSSEKREILALGETPNIAARLQGLAEPDTVVISAVTQRLVAGFFTVRDLGLHTLKGISTPLEVHQVLSESGLQSRFEVAVRAGLTPLVGREHEVGLLAERWVQATQGAGQAVLLSGEPGIGKSRLVQTLREQVEAEDVTRIEFRCSPYHQNSAFYPIVEHLQRLLQFALHDTGEAKLSKLQQTLSAYHFPQTDTLPLLTALLSLPHPAGVPPLTLSPQKQKQKTQEALVAWLAEEAERQGVYCVWEDLHWVDPSSLEVLSLLLEQIPTTRLLTLLTFRPEFTPPWRPRSHITHLTLNRLGRQQVEAMVENVTSGKALLPEMIQQIVTKTDGVPLFVEELTKTVLESVASRESKGSLNSRTLQALAIPATLQDSLMAQLDRLGPAKEVAQLGAVLGREFHYELLRAVSPLAEAGLQQEVTKLIEAELLYQRGLPPQVTYIFKHALIQDAAYQSLLKSTRQQYHRKIAQVLEGQFPGTKETQPELVAHHYTEAGLIAQAIPYWQRAGQIAIRRSANTEAISHLTRGLELLKAVPDTPERRQQELLLQTTLGPALMAAKGYAAPGVERAYARARELCRQMGETPRLLQVLLGLEAFYFVRGEFQTARELGEQSLSLAQRLQDPVRLLQAHYAQGSTLFHLGELASAREHLEQVIALHDPQKHPPRAVQDPGVACLSYAAWTLWLLGYPEQALKRNCEALTLAQELSHPFSLAVALCWAATLHQFRREEQLAREWGEATITLSTEQGFPFWMAMGTILRGWALAMQGQGEEGIAQICQSLAAYRAMGAELGLPRFLALLVKAYEKAGQVEEGLTALAEALALVDKTGERVEEAELYRLKGTLTLQKLSVIRCQLSVTEPRPLNPDPQAEAEECFLKAIDIAQKQQAKSLELRAVMSLTRLWQSQGKRTEAHQMLSEIYNWFTEGFDTKDLQEAKELIEELRN